MSYHPKILYVPNAVDLDGVTLVPTPPDDSGQWIAIDVRQDCSGWIKARALHPKWGVPEGGTLFCWGSA